MKYTIDTAIGSTVKADEQGNLLSCGESKRIWNVLILQEDGSYSQLKPNRYYMLLRIII